MSRIERALEKAASMRGPSGTRTDRGPEQPVAPQKCDRAVFNIPERAVEKDMVDRHIISIKEPGSATAEEYKKLRARIFTNTEKEFLNCIQVTSAFEGEGKTVTALNLAATIAQGIDHTVLLVDADLRRPSVHSYLGMQPRNGLSEYLQSKATLPEVLVKTGIGKLVVLPAGNPPENPAELLASEKMKELVYELKHRYRDRYVIFDSPPLLTTADSQYLKNYIDGVLFVVQAARTPAGAASQAVALLNGARVFGTVFNNVPRYLFKQGSYYGYSREAPSRLAPRPEVMQRVEDLSASVGQMLMRTGLRETGQKIKLSISERMTWGKKKTD